MPLPGRLQAARAIVHVDGLKRLGFCPQGLSALTAPPDAFTVSFAGIPWQSLSQDLADDQGRMPMILSDPNVSGAIEADGDGIWSAWWQTVNAGGCDSGQSAAIFVRLRQVHEDSTAYVLEQFVYSRLGDGTCANLLVFSSGGADVAALFTAAATLDNRAQNDNAIGGILDLAAGTATVTPA